MLSLISYCAFFSIFTLAPITVLVLFLILLEILPLSVKFLSEIKKSYSTSSETLEDRYQINRKHNEGALIFVQLFYRNNIKLPDDFELRLMQYNLNYNKKQKFFPINCSQNYIFYDKILFNSCLDYHYKFFIDLENNLVEAIVKHEYIGGSYLLELFYCFLSNREYQLQEFPKTYWYYSFLAIPLFLSFLTEKSQCATQKFSKCQQDEQMERFPHSFELIEENPSLVKYKVIQKYLACVFNLLQLADNEELKCYLPIAFQSKENIRNNIGLIWFNYRKNDDYSSIGEKLRNSRWQALASNAILNYFPKLPTSLGSTIRKNIDVVITFMIGTDYENNFDVGWTFEHISEYPIYLAIASLKTGDDKYSISAMITSSIILS